MIKKRGVIVHPALFALFPVLSLYAGNIKIVPAAEIILPAAVVILFIVFFWFLLGKALKNHRKAGVIASLFAISFFSYGRAPAGFGGILISAAFFAGAYWCIRTRKKLFLLTDFLNVVSITLVVIPLTYAVSLSLIPGNGYGVRKPAVISKMSAGLKMASDPPNIYYVILDGYAGADTLKNIYQYDNAGFLDFLAEKGFYIADQSFSNYSQTDLSLVSSLNMEYLGLFLNEAAKSRGDRKAMGELIKNSAVLGFLKDQGYTIIAFSSGWYGTEIKNADIYVDVGGAGLFVNELFNLTPLPYFFNIGYNAHRRSALNLFSGLEKKFKKEPFFVFAHILCPHPPFVFGPDGERINMRRPFTLNDGSSLAGLIPREKYVEEYRGQVEFTNKKMRECVEAIMSRYRGRAVIILQADHGPGSGLDHASAKNTNMEERFSILNAIYFPDNEYTELYSSMSPVNTFRVVLNRYFGTNLEMLEDKSYYSTWLKPYEFIDARGKE